MRWLLGIALAICPVAMAQAHRPSDAFLTLDVHGQMVRGQWEIALRDVDAALGLDADRDGRLTWGELRKARPRAEAWLERSLTIVGDARPCALRIEDLLVNERVDGRYAWFALDVRCQATPRTLTIDYALLFELDPTHRGLLVLRDGAHAHSAVFSPESHGRTFDLAAPSRWRAFIDYVREGIGHIWAGYDHVLFLLALLLPAVLRLEGTRWQPQPRLVPALWNVLGVVTAFTVAHSITLSLAALDLLRLPSRPVETAIALSVLLAALNNIRPVVADGRWRIAFAFGLIHGFGFASVLGELGLPRDGRLLAVFAFNLGVEIGQIAIVLAFVPLAFAARRTRFYQHGVRIYGSAAVALLAAAWIVQRLGYWSAWPGIGAS